MNAYLDIRLLPDPEFSAATLMNALFSKLHRGLVEQGSQRIGVSFPDCSEGKRYLGERLRIHGSALDLQDLMSLNWITGMQDHTAVGAISQVPVHARPRVVRRVQAKSSPERERRRLVARKGISREQAALAIPDAAAESLALPYVVLTSRSTGQQFRLFIEHSPAQAEAVDGRFSAYGLSPSATVPWF